jgi:TM2 domain-containing membrane protein YozV
MRLAGKRVRSESIFSVGGVMEESTTGRGSAGNIIAALASLIMPGLGQLAQGRIISALLLFGVSGILWVFSFGLLGWLGHVIACLDAALWRGPR